MQSLDQIIEQATSGRMNHADAYAYCVAKEIEISDLYNQVALTVAQRFQSGELPFEDGDGVMNALFAMTMDDAWGERPNPWVEPAWSIYLAFDAGEYNLTDNTDPIESFTRPQIRKILDDAQQLAGPERRERNAVMRDE